jgi:hypothetical protein
LEQAPTRFTLPAVKIFGRAAVKRSLGKAKLYQAVVQARYVPNAVAGEYEEQVDALFTRWNLPMRITIKRPTRIGEHLNLVFTDVNAFEGTMAVSEYSPLRSNPSGHHAKQDQ